MSDEPAGLKIWRFGDLELSWRSLPPNPPAFHPSQRYSTGIYPFSDCELDNLISFLLCPNGAKRRQRRGSKEFGSMRNIR